MSGSPDTAAGPSLEEKRVLLEGLLRARLEAGREAVASFAQERLWFLEQLSPGTARYHIAEIISLRGPLDRPALERSLNELIRRHEALRTTFPAARGTPVQRIHPPQPAVLRVIDLAQRPADEPNSEVMRLAEEEARRPFDLAVGPLFRATLIRVSADEHHLLFTLHHIIADAWSMEVLVAECGALYTALVEGRSSQLAAPQVQYAEYAAWQRKQVEEGYLDQGLSYWKRALHDIPPVLDLPADRVRPPAETGTGAVHRFALPTALTLSLKSLCEQERVTLFMTLLATFAALLQRYSGADEIVIGSPIAGRTRTELEGAVGLFVNSLPIRADLSGDPTFRELLERVRTAALGAFEHGDVPFETMVERVQPPRQPGRPPIFGVMLSLQSVPERQVHLAGLQIQRAPVQTGTAKFDLTLLMKERERGLAGWLEYNADLFDRASIARMMGHYLRLLEAVVTDPGQRVGQVSLATPEERRQALGDRNDTERDYPRHTPVHRLVEHQAELRPEAVAVIAAGAQLTYAELNIRANRLAHYLRALGVRAGTPVAVRMERSIDLIVTLLGVLKAGGMYLPLDPEYPTDRLAFMLRDAQAKVLVTREREPQAIPQGAAQIVYLDREDARIAEQAEDNPPGEATGDTLAYAVYTSGSTGTPRGIAIPHRAITRLVCNTDYVSLVPSDRVAQASNASFDAATFEIWGALTHGARLVMLDRETVLSPPALAAEIHAQGITTLFVTTALFNQVAWQAPGTFAPLRHLLFGGEASDPCSVERILEHGPPERLLHVYGPSESTAFATWHLVESVPPGARTISIGRPVANTRVYLLDPNLNPVPSGVPGEIYLGGDGLARGYLNDPALTAERFISHQFGEGPEERLYRTGDLGRYRPDGSVEFLGRTDHQIKIRGFRIEPAEIQERLRRHPDVRDAMVMPWEDRPGERRLVAYLIVAPGTLFSKQDLRRYLGKHLPEYMVPSAFVALDAFPLTPNGKLDRDALPPPRWEAEADGEYVAPRTPAEATLCEIVAEVLGIERVGLRDNFFHLGGHSLLAVRLLHRIEQEFGTRIPVSVLFLDPTVRHLTEVLERGDEGERAVIELQSGSGQPPFYFLHGQVHGGGGYSVALARLLGAARPFSLLPSADLEPCPTIEAMAASALDDLLRVQPHGRYRLGGYCHGGLVAYELARLLRERGERVDRVVVIHALPEHRLRVRAPRSLIERIGALFNLGKRERVKGFALMRAVNNDLRAIYRYRQPALPHIPSLAARYRQLWNDEIEIVAYAQAAYRPTVCDDIPMTLLWPEEEPLFEQAVREWRAMTRDVEARVLPGTHDSIIAADLPALAACIRTALDTIPGG